MNFFKKIIYNVLNLLFKEIFFKKWKLNFKNNNTNYLIVDIDNTICDTESFEPKKRDNFLTFFFGIFKLTGTLNNHYKYLDAPIIEKTSNFIKSKKNVKIIFLSARSFLFYRASKLWLKKHNFPVNSRNLILVDSARTKLIFFKSVIKFHPNITVIDDLSFGHSNGKIFLYDDVINEIKKTKMTYLGLTFIKKLIN